MKKPKVKTIIPGTTSIRGDVKPEKLEAPQRPKPTPKPPKKKKTT